MNRYHLAALTALILMAMAPAARSCSCWDAAPYGFLSAYAQTQDPRPLPANAKGVLFYWETDYAFGTETMKVLSELPEPLRAKDFMVRDLNSDEQLPATIEPIRAKLPGQSGSIRYFQVRDRRLAACLASTDDQSEACRKTRRQSYEKPEALLDKLRAGKGLTEVTAQVDRATGLFRVAPKGGFKPGHRYQFSYDAPKDGSSIQFGSLEVHIDTKPLALPLPASAVSLEREGGVHLSTVSSPAGGSCSKGKLAQVQALRYALPDSLAPYRDSMRFITQVRSRDGGFETWFHIPSLCSEVIFGRSHAGPAREVLHEWCSSNKTPHLAAVKGYFGFFEVEDGWHETATLPLDFAKTTPQMCDIDTALDGANPAADPDTLRDTTCAVAERLRQRLEEGQPPSRPSRAADSDEASVDPRLVELKKEWLAKQAVDQKLVRQLLGLAAHPNAGVRRCAIKGLGSARPLPAENAQATGGSGAEPPENGEIRRALAARFAAALADRDSGTRLVALSLLEKSARDWAFAKMLPKRDLDPLAIALAGLLRDRDWHTGASAATVLAHLGPAAEAALPTLLAVLAEGKDLNYRTVWALASVDTDRARVIANLTRLLPSYSLGNSAAQALSSLKPPALEATQPLIEQAKKGQESAIVALRAVAGAAREALPTLVALANSPDSRSRQQAIATAIYIAAEDEALMAQLIRDLGGQRQAILAAWSQANPNSGIERDAQRILNQNPSDADFVLLLRLMCQLQKLDGEGVPPEIMALLTRGMDSKTSALHEFAALNLLQYAPPDAHGLVGPLSDKNPLVVEETLRKLVYEGGKFGNLEPIWPLLIPIIDDDSHPGSQANAMEVIENHGTGNEPLCQAVWRSWKRHPPWIPRAEAKACAYLSTAPVEDVIGTLHVVRNEKNSYSFPNGFPSNFRALYERPNVISALAEAYGENHDDSLFRFNLISLAALKLEQQADSFSGQERKEAGEFLVDALDDEFAWVRSEAAWGLGYTGDASYLESVRALLTDGDEGVRGEAYRAVKRLESAKR